MFETMKTRTESVLETMNYQYVYYSFRVRDTGLSKDSITEVIVSGMDTYIPYTFSNPK